MSVIGVQMSAIKAALAADTTITAAGGVDVCDTLENAFLIATRDRHVFLLWQGFTEAGPGLMAAPSFTPGVQSWLVAVVTRNFRSVEDAMTETAGLFDLIDAIASIRSTRFAPTGARAFNLVLAAQRIVSAPDHVPNGGKFAAVTAFTTTKTQV